MENKTKLFIHPYVRRGLASYIDEVKDGKSNANVSVTLQLRAHKAYTLIPPEMPENEDYKSVSYKLVDIKKEDPKDSEKKDGKDQKTDKSADKTTDQKTDQKTDSAAKSTDDPSKTTTVDPKKEPAKEEGKDQADSKTGLTKTEDGKDVNKDSEKKEDPKKEGEKKEDKKKDSEKDILDELEQFLAEWQSDPAFASEQNVNISRAFTLAGPAEVQGINPSAIRRLFPAQGSAPLANTLIPYVEFYEDDLPWRFSPLKPEDGKLRPWLALVACKADEFSTEVYEGKTYLTLKGTKDAEGNTVCPLPDVEDIHLYAHAQMEKYTDRVDEKGEALLHTSVSRVLCVSKLEKNTEYTAFLIPTFKLGMPNNAGAGVKDCAWSKESYAGPYPVYYQWSFKTGEADFKALADLMHPMSAQQYNAISDKLDIDVCDTGVEYFHKDIKNRYGQDFSPLAMIEQGRQTDPMFGVLPVSVALTKMASARGINLVSASTRALVEAQEAALKDLLKHNPVFAANKADITGDTSVLEDEDPWVVPPVYGARHKLSSERTLDDGRDVVSQINLDLEHRMAAGMGATIVQQNQEDFVHRAWEQVEQVNAQNRIIKELSAMQSTNSIGQRRIMPHWKQGVDSALKAIKSDAALKVATRSRYVGSAAITEICKESSADAKATVMAPVEAPERPSGLYQSELEEVTNPRFWDDVRGNKKKFSGCIPENKVSFKSEVARWDLFKSFVPLKPYLSIISNLRTEEKKVDGVNKKVTSNEWLFAPKHELNTDWIEKQVKQYVGTQAYWGYEPNFSEWLTGTFKGRDTSADMNFLSTEVRRRPKKMNLDSLAGLANWLQAKSNSKSYQYALIEGWEKTDSTTPYCIALTGKEYDLVKEEIQKHKKDVTISSEILYLKLFTRTPKKDKDNEYDLTEHIIPVVNADAASGVKLHLNKDIILQKFVNKNEDGSNDIFYYIDPNASGITDRKEVRIKIGDFYFGYRWYEYKSMLRRTANYLSMSYFQSQVLNTVSFFDPRQILSVDGIVTLLVSNINKIYTVPFIMHEQYLDQDDVIGSLRAECKAQLDAMDKIQKYLLRPTYLTIPRESISPENEFAIMDFFNIEGEQTFENLFESTIKNIQGLKPSVDEFSKAAEEAKKAESAQKKADAAKAAETEKQIAIEESKQDTFATDINKKKLESILAKYNDGQGRTAEELAQRLWEIANSRYPIMAYPEFYDPAFFYLRELDSRYVLPAAGSLPQDSISVFVSNPAFEESLLSGMNTEMGKELLWREYPTDERGSYFRKFWDKEKLPDCVDDYFDVKEMHYWDAPLGHNHRTSDSTLAVFVIHAKLMRAFPDTQVVITARKADGSYSFDEGECFYPEMTSWLDNETFIAGFPLSVINYVKSLLLRGKEYCLAFRENAQGLQFLTKDIIRYEAPKEEEKKEDAKGDTKKDETKKGESSTTTTTQQKEVKGAEGETLKTDAPKPDAAKTDEKKTDDKKDQTKPLTEEEKKKAEEEKKKAEEEAKKKAEEEKKKKEEEEKAKKKASDFDSSLYAGHRVKSYTVWGCDIKDLIQNI